MANPSTSSGLTIEILHGPMAGQRLPVSREEAERAIKEGWARDAASEEPPKPADEKDKAKLEAAARDGIARILRLPELQAAMEATKPEHLRGKK